VKKQPSFARRTLVPVVRKAITAYYTEQEQRQVAQAARKQGTSMSSFVALASLAEAHRINRNK
jgi:uncharacterized protein (DUF1778 family)